MGKKTFGISNAETHNVLVHKIIEDNLFEVGSKYLEGKLIDIGCGEKPYKNLLEGFIIEHIGLDHSDSFHCLDQVELTGTAYNIPVSNEFFDSALCTAVLEHLEEPELALKECYRILKKGSYAVYTIPFIWHLHEEPRDFYRYSKYGIRYLFEKVGFEIIELNALSGFWVTFGQLFVYNMYRLNRGPLRWFKVIDALGLFIQGFAYLLDKMDKTEKWTWMYLIVVQKK